MAGSHSAPVAPPFAVREHYPVAGGEAVEHVRGQIGAHVFHQPEKRRLRLAERTLPGFDHPAVAVLVAPDALAARHPPTLDLDGVETFGTADDEIDLGEALMGMPGRLQGVVRRPGIVEGAAQSLEYPLLRLAAGVTRRARDHAHDGVQPPSAARAFAPASWSRRAPANNSNMRLSSWPPGPRGRFGIMRMTAFSPPAPRGPSPRPRGRGAPRPVTRRIDPGRFPGKSEARRADRCRSLPP